MSLFYSCVNSNSHTSTLTLLVRIAAMPFNFCCLIIHINCPIISCEYSHDIHGQTVLHYTAKSGNIKCLKFLLECGVDIHAKVRFGKVIKH